MNELTVGSLFAGIGGFDLGLERAGMRTLWFCEQDPYCQRVLARHWPGVSCHPDVRALVADTGSTRRRENAGSSHGDEAADEGRSTEHDHVADGDDESGAAGRSVPVSVPYVDVLCGGFPCQDLSLAGKGAGINGKRSGLWSEFARLIGELSPRYVIVENVPALLARGMGRVLGDLAALGYDAEWDCLPASAFGAPHRRDRVWIVAYPQSEHGGAGEGERGTQGGAPREPGDGRGGEPDLADPSRNGEARSEPPTRAERERVGAGGERSRLSNASASGQLRAVELEDHREGGSRRSSGDVDAQGETGGRPGQWLVEPDVGRVAARVPARVDRLAALGNALVPQIAEWIGRRIVNYERANAPSGSLTGTALPW